MLGFCGTARAAAVLRVSRLAVQLQRRGLTSIRSTIVLRRPETTFAVFHRHAASETTASTAKQPVEERGRGTSERMEFQAESRKFLEIVAKSLYSDKEVFIRELISNASDALERLRYLQMTGQLRSGVLLNETGAVSREPTYEIHLKTDSAHNTLTISDSGVGMARDELKKNLGIIARSGTSEFMKQVATPNADNKSAPAPAAQKPESSTDPRSGQNLIGQFGVGFYSTFMVAERVEVFSKSQNAADRRASRWWSDGISYFEISEAENVQPGTKIVLHLRQSCSEFSREEVVRGIISRFSQFVSFPVYLNGTRVNTVEALWMRDGPISEKEHDEFYKFLGGVDKPMYAINYKTDAPINIRALLYVPSYKPSLFEMTREQEVGVALYCRKVLIMPRANNVLPKWLRFLRGVIDSEDIPLNLSRELLQNSALLQRIQLVLTARIVRFFADQAKSSREDVIKNYDRFLENFGVYLREGMVTSQDVSLREQIARLLKFESNKLPASTRTTLPEYVERMKAGERTIYFAPAANRQLAESSAYFGAFTKRNNDTEVLYLYEPYDELVFMQLGSFDGKQFRSIENALGDLKDEPEAGDATTDMTQAEADEFTAWIKTALGDRISKARVTSKLTTSHPCAITVPELGAFRHLLRTELATRPVEEKYKVLQAILEVNAGHPLIKKLVQLRVKDEAVAKMLALQLFDNSMIAAGLLDDPKQMLGRLNDLLTQLAKF